MNRGVAACSLLLVLSLLPAVGVGQPTSENQAGAEATSVSRPGDAGQSLAVAPTPDNPAEPAAPPPAPWAEVPDGETGELIRAGRRLADETPAVLREVASAGGGYAGNALACGSCHRQGGTREGLLSWVGVARSYPRYHPRAGRVVALSEEVNSCLQRNLGAPPLPAESQPMRAILAWLDHLAPFPSADATAAFSLPDRRADLPAGEEVYRRACQRCHADDGSGIPGSGGPPLWGPDSYSTGSGLHRLQIAARFLRDQMPPGASAGHSPLSEDEAWDVAAYINSFARPEFPGLDGDYPVLSEKPADCPYPPFSDPFPADQHRYGPFRPILAEAEAARLGDWRRYWDELAGYRLTESLTARRQ